MKSYSTMTRLAGKFSIPELQLLAQVVEEIPDHMKDAPSHKDAPPQTEIPVDYYPGLGIAPLIRKV